MPRLNPNDAIPRRIRLPQGPEGTATTRTGHYVNMRPLDHRSAPLQQAVGNQPFQVEMPARSGGFVNTTPQGFQPAPGQQPIQNAPFVPFRPEAQRLAAQPQHGEAPTPPDVLEGAAALFHLGQARVERPALRLDIGRAEIFRNPGDTTISASGSRLHDPRSTSSSSASTPSQPVLDPFSSSRSSRSTSAPYTPQQESIYGFSVAGSERISPPGTPMDPLPPMPMFPMRPPGPPEHPDFRSPTPPAHGDVDSEFASTPRSAYYAYVPTPGAGRSPLSEGSPISWAYPPPTPPFGSPPPLGNAPTPGRGYMTSPESESSGASTLRAPADASSPAPSSPASTGYQGDRSASPSDRTESNPGTPILAPSHSAFASPSEPFSVYTPEGGPSHRASVMGTGRPTPMGTREPTPPLEADSQSSREG